MFFVGLQTMWIFPQGNLSAQNATPRQVQSVQQDLEAEKAKTQAIKQPQRLADDHRGLPGLVNVPKNCG